MRVTFSLTGVLAAAALAAGCGDSPDPISGENAPAITAPGTTIPYENGGADGSGADGARGQEPRGGVAGGPDSGTGG